MRAIAAFTGLFLVVACQAPPPQFTDAERAQVEAEVSALDRDLGSAVEVWDLETFLSFFSEDLSWALFGEVHHSLDSWAEQVTPFFSQGGALERCDFLNSRLQVLNRDVVISTSVVNCFAAAPDGPVLVIDHTWTAVWARLDEQWRIVNLSETYTAPGTEG